MSIHYQTRGGNVWHQKIHEALARMGYGKLSDAPHVWTCKGDGTGDIWIKAIQELEKLLRTLVTDPTLLHILITYLNGWYSGVNIRYKPPREFQRLLQEQECISWKRLFEGWLSQQWVIPHSDGQGEPPKVILRAISRILLCIVRHSTAVFPDKWHLWYAASISYLLMNIFVVGW
jgi:hypothetical protein